MKKKSLLILLLLPFVVSLLTLATTKMISNAIDHDISGIEWNYRQNEGFKVGTNVKLEAEGISDGLQQLSPGNDLVRSVENYDDVYEDPYAEIKVLEGSYYLYPTAQGKVLLTCSNEKGNVSRSFIGIIYENGAIIINPNTTLSQSNIDPSLYYGEYDLVNKEKVKSEASFMIDVYSDEGSDYSIADYSDNIEYTGDGSTFKFLDGGEANFDVISGFYTESFSFDIVDEAVNVYSFKDLMHCTNQSSLGEKVVLRKSLLSAKEIYKVDESSGKIVFQNGQPVRLSTNKDAELFGDLATYNFDTGKFDFSSYIYKFKTLYNHEYIDQRNAKNSGEKISDEVLVGVHIQKDFYGNGFTLNAHELTYPTDVLSGRAVPSDNDLFKGPLSFFSIGDPTGKPLIEAYGEDNISFYIDGGKGEDSRNLIIDDVKFKATSNNSDLNNFNYVGTVVDVYGDDITLKNSVISNGKTGLRVFSSMNFLLDNSYIYNSREFNLKIGTNEYIDISGNENIKGNYDGIAYDTTISSFMNDPIDSDGNTLGDVYTQSALMYNLTTTELSYSDMLYGLNAINGALNTSDISEDSYKNEVTVKDTYFGYSGLFSIAFDSLFNGPYLYADKPSFLSSLLTTLVGTNSLSPDGIGGISYPTKLKLSGKTRFYDYKDVNDEASLDASCLIDQNVSSFISGAGYEYDLTTDDFFPLKSLYVEKAGEVGSLYSPSEEKRYVNTAIAYYGGSKSYSTIDTSELEDESRLNDTFSIDILNYSLNNIYNSDDQILSLMLTAMRRCVPLATGFEPFKFVSYKGDGYLYGETPQIGDLVSRAGGK